MAAAVTPAPNPLPTAASKKWLPRKVVVTAILLIVAVVVVKGTLTAGHNLKVSKPTTSINSKPVIPIAAGYEKRPCDVDDDSKLRQVFDFSLSRKGSIHIQQLHTGCYADTYILPRTWARYMIQKGKKDGDYATAWCNGHSEPTEVFPSTTAMNLPNCFDVRHGEETPHFSLQGKGWITFTVTEYK